MSKSTNLEMDDILKKIISKEISICDLCGWLETNRSNVPEFKSLQNSQFIPHFLNYIKIKCSWLCRNDKTVDEVNDNSKTLTSNNISNGDPLAKVETRQSPFHPNNNTQKNNAVNYSGDFNQSMNVVKEYNNKRVHTFTFTPPYKQRGGFQRGYNINSEDFPPISSKHFGREYPAQKWVENRKENCRNVVNKVGSFNVKPFVPEENNRFQNINNYDAFPPLGSKPVDTKTRRRITPTPVQNTSNFRTKFGSPHFTAVSESIPSEAFKCSAFQENTSNLQHERELLKATKNIPIQSGVSEAKNLTNHIGIKSCETKSCDQFVYPNPESITMMREILYFSEIYSFLLKKSLVPNITSELYFLFELITSKTSIKDNLEKDLFCSIHNCVYFAVSVLGSECNLLHILDKATLASLLEIPYLFKFSPQLVHFLNLPSLSKPETNILLPSLTVVPFQVEEDSRTNFPDEYSFVSFKRQRDLFYEMLREWQQATDCVDGKFQSTFVRKARQLISFNPNSINMFHLARLFKSQLITSCMGLEVNDVYDELLNDIQRNFPDKFKKLQERFLTPSSSGKLATSPSFYGIQTFFAELITAAGSLTLNQHLINIFVSKILELNNTDIFSDGELSSLGTVRDKYIFLLHTLRLLGKFLGYLYYSPYSKEENTPAHIVNQQLSSRQHSPAPLNLPQLLKDSVSNGHTVLTIPWIVEFLSMIDPLGKNLNDIQETLTILTGMYRYNTFSSHNQQSHLFLQVVIGWLFGILNYPDNFHLLLQPIDLSSNSLGTGVDSLSVIDKQLIHSCCPYLIEFKVLVYNFLNGIKDKKREVRKITPLSSVNTNSSKNSTMTICQMEHHLEEHFFSLHPSSVKKTTEFVSERMASKVISQIRSEITSMKLKIAEDLMKHEPIIKSYEDLTLRRQCIDEILDKKIPEAFKDIQSKISLSEKSINSEINTIIPILLSTDTKDTVTEVCCKISFRMAVDKILDWCHANLLLEAIKTDIGNKVQHVAKNDAYGELTQNSNLSEWMSIIRETVVKIHLQSYEFDLNNVKSLCCEMTKIVVSTVSGPIKKIFVLMSVDLYVSLLTNYPEHCCEKFGQYFAQLWLKCPQNMTVGKLLICPQNLKFLLLSKNFDLVLKNLMSSFRILLGNEVLTIAELDTSMKEIKELKSTDFLQRGIKELLSVYEISFQNG